MLGKWGITLLFLFLSLEMVYSFSGLISDHLGQTPPEGGLCLRTFYITYLSDSKAISGVQKTLTSDY